jgi:hypothetical protein
MIKRMKLNPIQLKNLLNNVQRMPVTTMGHEMLDLNLMRRIMIKTNQN